MVYDATDKLVTWPGQHHYTYYPTGSLYQQKDSGGTVQKTYTYTGAELLESVTHAGVANPSTMVWDGDSNRVSFTSSTGGTTEFVYDPTAGIPAVIQEASPSAYVYYVREPNGALLMRDDGSTFHHYHFDALGSTRMITDYQGNVTDTYAYDAWGKLTNHTRNTGSVDQPYMYVGQLGYYSHYQDSNLFDESGQQMLQLGVRFYHPQTGRFMQMDPIGDGLNWYLYATGRPLSNADPTGTISAAVVGAVIAAIGILACASTACLKAAYAEAERIRQTNYDKVAHCYFACKAQWCTGGYSYVKGKIITEAMRKVDNTDGGDYAANDIGAFICADPVAKVLVGGMSPFASCESCCRRLTKGENDAEKARARTR